VDNVTEIYKAMIGKDPRNSSRDPRDSLRTILDAAAAKGRFLREVSMSNLEDGRRVLNSVFYTRKYSRDLNEQSLQVLRECFSSIKSSSSLSEASERSLCLSFMKGEDASDFAKEVLHFVRPSEFPLWTRWVWNWERSSGALAYVLKDGVRPKDDALEALRELREVLDTFGLRTGDYVPTAIFSVYAYVRCLDYTTLLAIDKKVAGLLPTHLGTTALVMGLKDFLKVMVSANT